MTRKKIIPEDLIQRTNIVQHNFMIDAINDLDDRQGIVEDINAVNTEDVATLKTDVIVLSNEKLDKDDINKDLHFGEITLTREGTSVMASLDVLNPATGVTTPISFTIPGATTTLAGVMPADDAAWITNAEARISALEGMANVKALVGLSTTPSQEEINAKWMMEVGEAPTTGDMMQDVSNGRLWVYVNDAWIIYATVVDIPLATTGSLGGVRDTALDAPANRWYCHVEADGRLALIGGDSLSTLLDTTIPGMQTTLNAKADSSVLNGHLGSTSNPHAVTKAQVGLGNVDNTSDADKPISTATQNALNTKADTSTLNAHTSRTDNPHAVTKAQVGLGNVDNTSDANKPVSGPQQAALSLKADKSELEAKADKSELEGLLDTIAPPVGCATLLTMFKNDTSITFTPIINASGCTSLKNMFSGCTKLRTVTCIYTSSVTDMESMFYMCTSLRTVPKMDTSSVTNMKSMFKECSSLTTAPEMDTSSVTNMNSMFWKCTSLTTVPEMDTSSVTNMNRMFYECSSLTTVPEMDVSSVTDMNRMFYGCSSLTTVPEMDVSSVTDMSSMFEGCSSLTSVTFAGAVVPPYGGGYMFFNTPIMSNAGYIYVPDNLVSSYKSASGWSAHANIIKGISEKP